MFKSSFIFLAFIVITNHALAGILPAGTEVKIRVEEEVNTQIRPVGYQVRAMVGTAIDIDDKRIIKQGAKAQLTVTRIQVATRDRSAGIELALTNLTIGNRAINVSSYPVGGRGELVYIQYPDQEGPRTAKEGEILDTIPVLTKDNYLELTIGTVIYFILAEDVIY